MAAFTLENSVTFPNGTTVKVYPASNWPNPGSPSGAPVGSSVAEKTVASGKAEFTGLTENVPYYAVAEVGGAYRYISIKVTKASSGGGAGAEEVATEKSRAEAAEELKLAKASNLSDLASAATARTSLGLGTAATKSEATFATPAEAALKLAKASNLSDVASVSTARLNISSYRADIVCKATGLVGESFPRQHGAIANQLLATKKPRAVLVGLIAGEVITNIYFCVDVAGATLTLVRLGLWKKDGTVLAKSADLKANFLATGVKGGALESPYTVPTTDAYYIGILAVGTTCPSILCGASGTTGFTGQVIEGPPICIVENTEKEAIETLALTGTSAALWCGWS